MKSSKQELFKNLEWLIQHDPKRFNFIEVFMKAVLNKESISVEMSLNKTIHIVTVRFGDYFYKKEFKTLEKAMVLINMVKCVKGKVA